MNLIIYILINLLCIFIFNITIIIENNYGKTKNFINILIRKKQNSNVSEKIKYNYNINAFYNKLSNKKEKINIGICLIVKNTRLFIGDWLKYYKTLGVSKIIIGDNNNNDNDNEYEKIEPLIFDYLNENFVQIINLKSENQTGRQDYFYIICYNLLRHYYDWIYFLDDDEFLTLSNKNLSLYSFHNLNIFKNCSCILPFWRFYDDGNILRLNSSIKPFYKYYKPLTKYTDKIIMKNFSHYKSLVKGNLIVDGFYVHFPKFKNEKKNFCCFTNGNIPESYVGYYNYYTFKNAYIKHFYYKGTYDFCFKFYKRGFADINKRQININSYFINNKITLEKIKIFEKCLNISLNKEKLKILSKRYI